MSKQKVTYTYLRILTSLFDYNLEFYHGWNISTSVSVISYTTWLYDILCNISHIKAISPHVYTTYTHT